MIKPQKNDIWVAPGYQSGQVVYRILATFSNKAWSHKYQRKITVDMVKYQIQDTSGKTQTREYPISSFLNKPVGSHGGLRKLAVRPVI